jgi:thioredoxin reductase (NADPH)
MTEPVRDVAIVGGGPAGLSAGLYLCRSKVDAVLYERELTGGQAVYSPLIENYPGFPEGIEGAELVGRIKTQAERFGLETTTFARVEGLKDGGETKTLLLEDGEVRARAVIIASGRSPRKMGIPGEDEYTGRGISYCATCDAPLFREKVVMVIGGGDAAVEEALHLVKFASKVILVHRRDELRASGYLKERALAEPKLEFVWNSELAEVKGDNTVESAVVVNNETNERTETPVSGIFIYVGNLPNSSFVADLIELDDAGYIKTDEAMATNVPGIFAAGDVRANQFKQVIISAAEGALTASSAQRYLEKIGARKAYGGAAL